MHGHENWVRSVAFDARGARLVSASDDSTARVWDAKTGLCLQTLRGHKDYVLGACFSSDGKMIASASSPCQFETTGRLRKLAVSGGLLTGAFIIALTQQGSAPYFPGYGNHAVPLRVQVYAGTSLLHLESSAGLSVAARNATPTASMRYQLSNNCHR